ncbi:flagella assembly protein FlgT middle domain-containing protein [Jeongeupia chitinilytica]|uniref:Flagellar assembly protein T middle domain-containing protein n=1 Tax=Jeongeupia chitinilytica TaxID=1041641 RepID=A0ABQ3H2L3_9NEIS|nr:flagella assembly protein FlgT middle domain-containing protein [Jeongeupia chitinilytica]GHD67131.1 hypothetical protein GCM10007350_30400 [Jeongeupia chitinilytica]
MSLVRFATALALLSGVAQAADDVTVTPLNSAQLGRQTVDVDRALVVTTAPYTEPVPAQTAPLPSAADPAGQTVAQPVAAQEPQVPPARLFKRSVVVLPFVVRQPGQIADLPQFLEGTQDILRRSLDLGGKLNARIAPGEGAFALQPGMIDVQWKPERVRELARRYGSQFVVGGVVDDASTTGVRFMPAVGTQVKPGESKLSLSLPIFDFFGFGLKRTPAARNFDATLYLFDGVSGALLGRFPLQAEAGGDVLGDPRQAVAGAGFVNGDYGQVVAGQLAGAAAVIAEKIRCQPFSARVVGLSQGQVVLDAGTAAGLRPGDTLQLYRLRSFQLPVDSLNGDPAQRLGMIEDRGGVLTVEQIQPLMSLATMSGAQAEVGDYARWDGAGH